MKGGRRARMYRAPLCRQVDELLSKIGRHEGNPYVFTHGAGKPACGFSRYKKLIDAALAKAGVDLPPWRIHDFRRSFTVWATGQQEDFDFDTAEMADRILGHEPYGRVRKAYNPSSFASQRRHLLTAWADYLTGEKAQKPDADIVDAEFEEVILAVEGPKPKPAPSLPGPEPAPVLGRRIKKLVEAHRELVEKLEFARDAYMGLLFTVTDPRTPPAILSMLRRGLSEYKPDFREKFPAPMSEIGRFAVQYVLDQTVMVAYRCFSDPTLSKLERAQAVQKAVQENLADVYIKGGDTNATTLANAAIDAALTRWPLREREKAGSKRQPDDGDGAAMRTAA
jgi:hypothetical protein